MRSIVEPLPCPNAALFIANASVVIDHRLTCISQYHTHVCNYCTLRQVVELCTHNFCIRVIPASSSTHSFPYTRPTNLYPSFMRTSAIYQSNISVLTASVCCSVVSNMNQICILCFTHYLSNICTYCGAHNSSSIRWHPSRNRTVKAKPISESLNDVCLLCCFLFMLLC